MRKRTLARPPPPPTTMPSLRHACVHVLFTVRPSPRPLASILRTAGELVDLSGHPDTYWKRPEDAPGGLLGYGLPLTDQSKVNMTLVLKELFGKMHMWREMSKTEAGYPADGEHGGVVYGG